MTPEKELLSKLNSGEKKVLKEILFTPYSKLLQEIKEQDYQDKKELIGQLETFQKIHKKKPSDTTKEIIINLIADLEEVSGRISRVNEIMKRMRANNTPPCFGGFLNTEN